MKGIILILIACAGIALAITQPLEKGVFLICMSLVVLFGGVSEVYCKVKELIHNHL